MKKSTRYLVLGVVALAVIFGMAWSQFTQRPTEATLAPGFAPAGEIPVKGMATLVDLGSDSCIPCKMMAPILEKVEKKYRGKAAVIVIDVWKDKAAGQRFGIRAIPTQIFYDKNGKEVYRHVGFMSEADIDSVLAKLVVG